MSWYNEVNEAADQIKPGTYSARLTSAKHKVSKKGDNMVVLTFSTGQHYVSKYIVVRQDLARMWIGELAKIGVKVTDAIAEAKEDALSFEQFFWLLLERVKLREHATIEIGVSFTAGSDMPNVSIRSLVSDPPRKGEEWSKSEEVDPGGYSGGNGPDDEIPF